MHLRQLALTFLVIVNISTRRCHGVPTVVDDGTAPHLTYFHTLNEDISGVSVPAENLRFKRGATLAAKGVAALGKLLEGSAQLAPRSMRQTWFEKTGDISAAQEDFFSVRPHNVKIFSGHVSDGKSHLTKVKTFDGKVGDRRMILKSYGEQANPVLEIIDTSSNGPHVDIIIYKKDR